MSHILLAIGDRELRRLVSDELKKVTSLSDLNLTRVSEFSTAQESLEDNEDISLVVIDYDLAYQRGQISCDMKNQPVAMAAKSGEFEDTPRFLILGPVTRADDAQAISLLTNTETIDSQQMFYPDKANQQPFIVSKIISMAGNPHAADPGPEKLKGLIEVVIDNSNLVHCSTRLIFPDGRNTQRYSKNFQYDSGIKKILELCTNTLMESEISAQSFRDNYEMIGQKTREILNFHEATKRAIINLIHRVNGVKNIWIQFRVPYRNMPSIPFEAILQCDRFDEQEQDSESSFQLVHSPVYRVVGDPSAPESELRAPFLSGLHKGVSKKISCLVIDASTSGPVDRRIDSGLPASLDKISEYGAREIDIVSTQFSEMSQQGVVIEIGSISFESDAERQDPVGALSDKIASSKWDIIHFSGHSYFKAGANPDQDDGYIFLPGKRAAIPVNIIQVADWFNRANLVFMSSCQSAEPAFVNALAERGIPTIIGFRWKVSSIGATQFAGLFYYNLFHGEKTGDIEPAFVEAQRSLMDPSKYPLPSSFSDEALWSKPDERAWASPMLVMQNV
jgi:hypothetical protein